MLFSAPDKAAQIERKKLLILRVRLSRGTGFAMAVLSNSRIVSAEMWVIIAMWIAWSPKKESAHRTQTEVYSYVLAVGVRTSFTFLSQVYLPIKFYTFIKPFLISLSLLPFFPLLSLDRSCTSLLIFSSTSYPDPSVRCYLNFLSRYCFSVRSVNDFAFRIECLLVYLHV